MRYFLLWLVLPFMVALSFYGNLRRWEKNARILATIFSPLFHLHRYRQVASIFTFISDYFVELLFLKCLRSIETRKLRENCGTQTAKLNLARHKKRCSVGTLFCTKCPNFSTKSRNDLIYRIAKKCSAPKPDITFKCKHCFQDF